MTGCIDAELEADALELEAEQPGGAAVEVADELAGNNGATPYSGPPVLECLSHNVIGVLPDRGGDCSLAGAPPLPNWQWHAMFDEFTPDLADWTEPVPGQLQRFCIFEYVGLDEPNPEDYSELFAAIELYSNVSIDSVAPDCRGEVVQGNGLDDPAVTTELVNAFHRAIQWIPGEELEWTASNRRYAEVAIVDTVSQLAHEDPYVDPVNQHGQFMGDIVNDIACAGSTDPACEDAIRYHIAMPREAGEYANWVEGGEFGTMGDLAMSVVAAVGHWRERRLADSDAPPRLIISASLGWVPEAPVTTDPNRGPVLALEEALYFAACNGAIVLAAAGNTTDAACGHLETDPLAPASYELVPAPTEAECLQRGYEPIDSGNYPVFADPRPLVYAIGGLDGRDRPIANARSEAMSGLAAYAANASVHTASGFTLPLTGTSVSTAVVAATASLVWSFAPELSPDQVMKVIFESGYETELVADFDFTQMSPKVRRVSVCAALQEVCAQLPAGHCPTPICDNPEPPGDGHLGSFFDAVDIAVGDPNNVVDHDDAGPGQVPVCTPPTWDEQIDPQPELPACPTCKFDSPPPPDSEPYNDILTMSLATQYKGLLVSGILVTYDANGSVLTFTLKSKTIDSLNDPWGRIVSVGLEAPGTVAASLTFTMADGSSQSGPIPVKN
ncbi:MAG TPA: S8/S53 family peptidase [Enhygromyxa sp.]|nr:S8/S53 family peptidase [Enhygromyxa sp.]